MSLSGTTTKWRAERTMCRSVIASHLHASEEYVFRKPIAWLTIEDLIGHGLESSVFRAKLIRETVGLIEDDDFHLKVAVKVFTPERWEQSENVNYLLSPQTRNVWMELMKLDSDHIVELYGTFSGLSNAYLSNRLHCSETTKLCQTWGVDNHECKSSNSRCVMCRSLRISDRLRRNEEIERLQQHDVLHLTDDSMCRRLRPINQRWPSACEPSEATPPMANAMFLDFNLNISRRLTDFTFCRDTLMSSYPPVPLCYALMEYLPCTLNQLVDRLYDEQSSSPQATSKPQLSLRVFRLVLLQMAAVLQDLQNGTGFEHNDLHKDNLALRPDDRAMLTFTLPTTTTAAVSSASTPTEQCQHQHQQQYQVPTIMGYSAVMIDFNFTRLVKRQMQSSALDHPYHPTYGLPKPGQPLNTWYDLSVLWFSLFEDRQDRCIDMFFKAHDVDINIRSGRPTRIGKPFQPVDFLRYCAHPRQYIQDTFGASLLSADFDESIWSNLPQVVILSDGCDP